MFAQAREQVFLAPMYLVPHTLQLLSMRWLVPQQVSEQKTLPEDIWSGRRYIGFSQTLQVQFGFLFMLLLGR